MSNPSTSQLFRNFIENQLITAGQKQNMKYSNIKKSLTNASKIGEQITVNKVCSQLQKNILKIITQRENQKQKQKKNKNFIIKQQALTFSKIGTAFQNVYNERNMKRSGISSSLVQSSQENLQKNEVFLQSIQQIGLVIFNLAYSHPLREKYPKYNIQNVIGFYQISKWIYHNSSEIFQSAKNNPKNFNQSRSSIRHVFNQQIVSLLFTQKIMVYKDIYYRIDESSMFKNFIQQIFGLIQLRIRKIFTLTGLLKQGDREKNMQLQQACIYHIKIFIQKYHMMQNSGYQNNTSPNKQISNINVSVLRHSSFHQHTNNPLTISSNHMNSYMSTTQLQIQQFLNSISIDQIIICFVYLAFRLSKEYSKRISIDKILYKNENGAVVNLSKSKKGLGQQLHNAKIVQFYNSFYTKFYFSDKLEKINKANIQFEHEAVEKLLAKLVDNQETVLDYFVSSLDG